MGCTCAESGLYYFQQPSLLGVGDAHHLTEYLLPPTLVAVRRTYHSLPFPPVNLILIIFRSRVAPKTSKRIPWSHCIKYLERLTTLHALALAFAGVVAVTVTDHARTCAIVAAEAGAVVVIVAKAIIMAIATFEKKTLIFLSYKSSILHNYNMDAMKLLPKPNYVNAVFSIVHNIKVES